MVARPIICKLESYFAGVFQDALDFTNDQGIRMFMWRIAYTGGMQGFFVTQEEYEQIRPERDTFARISCDLMCDKKQVYSQKPYKYEFEGIDKDFQIPDQIEFNRGSWFRGLGILADKNDWISNEGKIIYTLQVKDTGSKHRFSVSKELFDSVPKNIGGYLQLEGEVDNRIVSYAGPNGRWAYKTELKIIPEIIKAVQLTNGKQAQKNDAA